MRKTTKTLILLLALTALSAVAEAKPKAKKPTPATTKNPIVVIQTSAGTIKAELFADRTPVTVKNFLRYADEKYYDGTIFHRVIAGFMIQGGGFDAQLNRKPTHEPIVNEAKLGPKNTAGTLAMARTPDPNSASSQFFINAKDNVSLDYRGDSPDAIGYAVFGRVIEGTDVVKKIERVQTGSQNGMADVPVTPVVIQSVRLAK